MMNNEKQVNEAMENEVLEAEAVDGRKVEKAKNKKQRRTARQWCSDHPLITGAVGSVLAGIIGFAIGKGRSGGNEDYPSEEPAYLPSGEDPEI